MIIWAAIIVAIILATISVTMSWIVVKKVLAEVQVLKSEYAKTEEKVIGSTSRVKGRLGELIAYLQLNASYDRIIPWGDVADYICIRWDKDDKAGTIDFVEVKNTRKRLSKDQKALKKLIDERKFDFKLLEVKTMPPKNNEELKK